MTAPFEELAALASRERAEFLCLSRLTRAVELEDAGLVEIVKWFEGKVPHTSAKLTAEGEEAVHRYWEPRRAPARRAPLAA